MIVQRTERFRHAYKRLTDTDRERVDRALLRLAADMRHPSLRVKKMQGVANVWEARASDELRITFEAIPNGIRLRMVGHHDATLRSP